MLLLCGLVVARACIYAVQGVGFVHDDWAMVGHGQLLGVGEISSTPLLEAARPGQWLTFAALFGISGTHPLVLFILLTVLNAVAAVVLWRVALRFLRPSVALAVAAIWLVLPNHTTLTVWGATSYVVVGLILLLLGVLALSHGRWVVAIPLLVMSAWSYEVAVVPALLAVALVPGRLQLEPPARPVDLVRRLVVAGSVIAAALRSIIDPIYPATPRVPDAFVVWAGHFGSGLLGRDEPTSVWMLLAAAICLGVLVSLLAFWQGARGRDDGPALVIAGLVVLAAGLGAGFTIPLGSVGMSDRLHSVSSIGSALVLVGLGQGLRRWQPRLLVPAAAVLLVVCVVGQVVGLTSWSRSARDVQALVRAVDEQVEDPASTRVVVGPVPLDRHGIRSLSGSEVQWIATLYWGGDRDNLVLSTDQATFAAEGPDTVLLRWDEITDTSGSEDLAP